MVILVSLLELEVPQADSIPIANNEEIAIAPMRFHDIPMVFPFLFLT